MTNQPPRELFTAERPIRSDFSQERSYARRRIATLVVFALVIGGTVYALWGHNPPNPADIPTIKAEGTYKQKPADPGGIDIPHQDVRVYDELEGKNAAPAQVEHLLPPPETPKEVEHVAAPVPAAAPAPAIEPVAPKPIKTTVAPRVNAAPPTPAPISAVATAPVGALPPPAPAPQTAPVSINQVIANTRALAPTSPAPPTPSASGSVAVQLASVSDETKAQAMLLDLNKKYASTLGGANLHLVRADLGAKGIYYRIQSQGLTEEGANRICSSLKQMNAGCILVRK